MGEERWLALAHCVARHHGPPGRYSPDVVGGAANSEGVFLSLEAGVMQRLNQAAALGQGASRRVGRRGYVWPTLARSETARRLALQGAHREAASRADGASVGTTRAKSEPYWNHEHWPGSTS